MVELTKREQLSLQWKSLRFEMWDNLRDAFALFVPIFVVTGMFVACVRFWFWIFW